MRCCSDTRPWGVTEPFSRVSVGVPVGSARPLLFLDKSHRYTSAPPLLRAVSTWSVFEKHVPGTELLVCR